MILDCIIIGGGVSAMQCALVLGSANVKPFVKNKKIGIIPYQKTSHLKNALFNNVLGIKPKKLGKDILIEGKNHLTELYPHIIQKEDEKVIKISKTDNYYEISTNRNKYYSKINVIALNYSNPLEIIGLEKYVEKHCRANPNKNKIQLKNDNHLVEKGLYVCGTLAGWRSQFAIAAGSGASVATYILTLWNDNILTKINEKIN